MLAALFKSGLSCLRFWKLSKGDGDCPLICEEKAFKELLISAINALGEEAYLLNSLTGFILYRLRAKSYYW
jgi:hypothetical protein